MSAKKSSIRQEMIHFQAIGDFQTRQSKLRSVLHAIQTHSTAQQLFIVECLEYPQV
jgi:hypothetical protein